MPSQGTSSIARTDPARFRHSKLELFPKRKIKRGKERLRAGKKGGTTLRVGTASRQALCGEIWLSQREIAERWLITEGIGKKKRNGGGKRADTLEVKQKRQQRGIHGKQKPPRGGARGSPAIHRG